MPNCCRWNAAATTTDKASVAVTTTTKMKCWWEYASTFPALAVWPALADKLLLRPNSKAAVVASWIKNSNALHEVFQAKFFLVGSVAITKCSHLWFMVTFHGYPKNRTGKSLVKATGVCAFLTETTMLSLTAAQVLPDFQSFCCFSESLNWNDLAENYMQLKTAIQKEWRSQPSPDFNL